MSWCWLPSGTGPSEPWVRAVGRPVDVTFNRSNAPIDPRPWSYPARAASCCARSRPDVVHVHEPFTPSTAMWATLAAEAPVVATFHTGAERSRLYDLAAPVLRRIARRIVDPRSPCPGWRSARRARGSAGRSRSCRTARTSPGSPMPSRRRWGPAPSSCSSAGWMSARGSPSPWTRSRGWRRIVPSSG